MLQGQCVYHGLSYNLKIGGGKDKQSAMDEDKKRKTVTPIWRPVCTQAISSEGYLHVPSKYHLAAGMIDPKNLSGSISFFFFFLWSLFL